MTSKNFFAGMSEEEMFLKAYERGNPQFWLNRTKPKKKKEKKKKKKTNSYPVILKT
tara:strand:- start:23680 stop:23847 length:168 start_codon:yes stop_codon:yes gene_type:complete